MHKILVNTILLLHIPITFILAQTITGKVVAKETGEVLSNCTISIIGTNRGSITNLNGEYRINLPYGKHWLLFQYIGYKSEIVIVNVNQTTITLNVSLSLQYIMFNEIMVLGSQYTEAEQLILKASETKKKSLSRLQNFSCKSYTKTILNGYADSLRNRYGLILEFYSRLFWNSPSDYYEIIESQRQSANLPESFNIFSGDAFLDANADKIFLGQKVIIGPTAPEAIQHYNFEIIDTLYQDNKRIFKLSIEPKQNNQPLMSGLLYLVDKIFVVEKIDVDLNKQCDYDFFKDLHIEQLYRAYNDSIYLPYYSRRQSAWVIDLPRYPKLNFIKEAFREEYQINKEINKKYAGQTNIIFENTTSFDSVAMNIPPLTAEEIKGYARIDSIVNKNLMARLVIKSARLLDFYSSLKKLPIGDFSDFYRSNQVEGNFIGFAVDSKKYLYPFRIYAGYGKGRSDGEDKFFVQTDFNYSLGRLNFAFSVKRFKSIEMREENVELPIWLNTFYSLIDNFDYFDYYYSHGNIIKLSLGRQPLSINASYFSRSDEEAFIHNKKQKSNGGKNEHGFTIDQGKLIGAKFLLKSSTAGYRQSSLSKEMLRKQNYIEHQIEYEIGSRPWGSDYGYQKILYNLYLEQNTYSKGILSMTILAGLGIGNLPAQCYYELESGFSGYERFRTFRTLGLNAFVGKNKLAVYLDHNFQNSFFRFTHLPIIKNWPYDLSIIYNLGWAGDKRPKNLKLYNFYSECGIGVGQLFSILKIEFLWRMHPVVSSKDFVYTLKMTDIEL